VIQDSYLGKYFTPGVARPGTNYQTAEIPFGALVCRDIEATDTDAGLQLVKRTNGVKLPNVNNILAGGPVGVVQCGTRKALPASGDGLIQQTGIARAKIYLPAVATLASVPAGTLLAIGSEWDSTNHVPKYGKTVGGTFHGGVLEALMRAVGPAATATAAIREPANPVAVLLETLTPAAAASVVLATVELLPRKLLPVPLYFCQGVPVAKTYLLHVAAGPGLFQGISLHVAGACGTDNSMLVTPKIAPALAVIDPVEPYSTNMQIDDNATDDVRVAGAGSRVADITGLIAALNGDTSTHGVLKAANLRQFDGDAYITMTVGTVPASGVQLVVSGNVLYF
jgi:hypothetical protein